MGAVESNQGGQIRVTAGAVPKQTELKSLNTLECGKRRLIVETV